VVFLLWMNLTAYVILLGAELDAEMERQTMKDTTAGPEKPMGERGAHSADTLGESQDKREAA
jgi:membrane protein